MKRLSQALKDTNITAEPLAPSSVLFGMPARGSTTKAGKMTMRSTHSKAMGSKASDQSTSEPKPHLVLLRDDVAGRRRLSSLLLICFDTLETFGKEPEQLANADKLFQFVLGEFTYAQVEKAFGQYIKHNTAMPQPADIVSIINPVAEDKQWSATAFIDIKKRSREGQFITNAEKQYCEDYIQAMVAAAPDQKEAMSQMIAQVEQSDRQYWLCS